MDFYYHAKRTLVQTLFQLILGGIMLGHGFRDDCNNGATDYLFTGGAIIVAANILPFIRVIVILVAVFKTEDCVDIALLCVQFCLSLVSFGVTIWVGKVLHRNFYRTQVSGVRSLGPGLCPSNLTHVTWADEDTNSILTDNANRAIQALDSLDSKAMYNASGAT